METIVDIVKKLLAGADWIQIFGVLIQSLQTLLHMFGGQ